MNTSLTSQPADSNVDTSVDTGVDNSADVDTAANGQPTQPEGTAHAAPAGATSARALLKQLQQQFVPFRDCLPLSIGIDKQILASMPGIDRKLMRAALGIHTGSQRYLRTMEKATVRYNLDGTKGAEVTDVHRKHAKDTLQERFRKEADRKKAERDAAAEEEANRRRQEKLEQLTAKFSRKG
ncbi:hypothetical protein GCM10007388_19930 [Pseudoduganella plicata]|uniref:Activator of osmoprotectant transporter prop n=2 Tax=Pseudoduganella plicata TaxID=321984 RepID=A0A4P7BKZ3_9BURK|nr:activator of osmoprotectant transporter prop [Pseudoduganella plicata]GGY86665.1 hypothetical protein GCM10007388_19930 [Pseudoduganella plicata]